MALYEPVRAMLAEPTFLKRGGTLGFFCHHAYAHSSASVGRGGIGGLPGAGLKGVDLVVWEVFRALGCRVRVVPVVQKHDD